MSHNSVPPVEAPPASRKVICGGPALGEAELDGEVEALGLTLGDAECDGETDGLGETLALGETLLLPATTLVTSKCVIVEFTAPDEGAPRRRISLLVVNVPL